MAGGGVGGVPRQGGLLPVGRTLVTVGAAGVVGVSPESVRESAAFDVMLGSEATSPNEAVKAACSAVVRDLRFRLRLPAVVLVIWKSKVTAIPATAGSVLATLVL